MGVSAGVFPIEGGDAWGCLQAPVARYPQRHKLFDYDWFGFNYEWHHYTMSVFPDLANEVPLRPLSRLTLCRRRQSPRRVLHPLLVLRPPPWSTPPEWRARPCPARRAYSAGCSPGRLESAWLGLLTHSPPTSPNNLVRKSSFLHKRCTLNARTDISHKLPKNSVTCKCRFF
jgi:hypothetical protein